jgi:hypothetical protein
MTVTGMKRRHAGAVEVHPCSSGVDGPAQGKQTAFGIADAAVRDAVARDAAVRDPIVSVRGELRPEPLPQ